LWRSSGGNAQKDGKKMKQKQAAAMGKTMGKVSRFNSMTWLERPGMLINPCKND
jgi:hypothetical protein